VSIYPELKAVWEALLGAVWEESIQNVWESVYTSILMGTLSGIHIAVYQAGTPLRG